MLEYKSLSFQSSLSSDDNLCLYSFPWNSRGWRGQAILFFLHPFEKCWPVQEWGTQHVADLQMVLFIYLFYWELQQKLILRSFSLPSYSISSVAAQWLSDQLAGCFCEGCLVLVKLLLLFGISEVWLRLAVIYNSLLNWILLLASY